MTCETIAYTKFTCNRCGAMLEAHSPELAENWIQVRAVGQKGELPARIFENTEGMTVDLCPLCSAQFKAWYNDPATSVWKPENTLGRSTLLPNSNLRIPMPKGAKPPRKGGTDKQ